MFGNKLFNVLLLVFASTRGAYSCLSNNGTTVTLNVEEYKQVGTTVYRECYCDDSVNSKVKLKWLYPNGTEISTESLLGSKSRIYAMKRDNYQQYEGVDLHISKLTQSMSGTYKCVFQHDGQQISQNYRVIAYESLYFINTSEQQFISLNKNSTIQCEVKGGAGELFITWKKLKDKEQILQDINDNEKYEIVENGLIVKNVELEDEGIYICDVWDMKGTGSKNSTIKVEVMIEPVIEDVLASPETTVAVGESLVIECKADGTPYPEFRWRRIFDSIQKPKDAYSSGIVKINKLVFDEIEPRDQGTYECVAKNKAGESRRQIDIKVLVPPQIIDFQNITEVEGNTIELICNTTGRPEPKVSIIYLGKNSNEVQITEANVFSNFAFVNVTPSMQGYYSCNASNEVDYAEEIMYVSVLYRPYFTNPYEIVWGWNGASVNLSCENDANPVANWTWRYMGLPGENEIPTDDKNQILELTETLNEIQEPYFNVNINNDSKVYGDYECTAKNNLGENKKRIILVRGFVPPSVSNVSGIVKVTDAIFTIAKTVFQGPDIIAYMAEYDEDTVYDVISIHKNRTWSIDREDEGFKLEGLKPDTTYQIKFAAKNNVGTGEWGQSFKFTTLKPSAPSPPVWEADTELLNVTEDQLLKWKAPDDNGDPIDNYIIQYCQDCKEDEESCKERVTPNSTLQMETSFLNPNSTYCIHLRAKNNIGISVATNITVMTTDKLSGPLPSLTSGAIIGIAVVIVFLALVVLDLLLCGFRRQGMIALCYYNENRTSKDDKMATRDKKGLLKDNGEPPEDNAKKHKEFEYNRATGIITGKHSSV